MTLIEAKGPKSADARAALRDDELIPLLRSCTYDMPHVTDEDRRVLAYRLAHSPLRLVPADAPASGE